MFYEVILIATKEESPIHASRVVLVILALSLTLAGAFAQAPVPVTFVSAQPQFAKIALTADSQKVLLLAFDESRGTGKGYDTVYADIDLNDVIEAGEKLVTDGDASDSFLLFKPVSFPFAYNAAGKDVPDPLSLVVARTGSPYGSTSFVVSLTAHLRQGNDDWAYNFRAALRPVKDRSQAPILTTQPLRTEITTRRDGGLGIAVQLSAGDFMFNCQTPQGSPQIHLAVTNAAGKTVSDTTVPLDRLGYG